MDYRLHPGLDPEIDPRNRLPTVDTSISPRSDSSDMDTGTNRYPDYCKTMIVKDSNGQVKELVFPKALDLDRPKRARTTFSPEQLYQLEREFQRNQYLVGRERTDLSRTLQLSETQIKVWFQNRRTKYKRDKPNKDHNVTKSSTESMASSNIMKILQPRPPVTINSSPSTVSHFPPTISAAIQPHPHAQQPYTTHITSPAAIGTFSHYRPLPFPVMTSHPGLFTTTAAQYLPRT